MEIEDFERYSETITNWIANYYREIRNFPVLSQVKPREIFDSLPTNPPEEPEPFEKIFEDFQNIILKGVTHWQHPRFFAYFPANTSFPSILAEFLTSALGIQAMMWITSPSAAELEEKVMDWLKKMMQLSENFHGVIQDTASTSTLVAILTAREKATNFEINKNGFSNQKFTVYCSVEAHSSIEKAVKIAGIGSNNLRKIPVDENFSMKTDLLEQAIKEDVQNGFKPICIVGAFGTTGSTAVDPLEQIGEIANRYGIWYHIDGAMVGSALILPEFQHYLKGINTADSFVFNPHKWLFTNFDCSAFFVKDKRALLETFQLTPSYLATDFDQQVNNYRDWGIQLGRRFRALKLWFVLRSFGIKGLQDKLRYHISLAKQLEKEIRSDGRFEILAPVNFNTICFRYKPTDANLTDSELNEINKNLLDKINASGFAFLSHTTLKNKFTLRFSIGQTNTTSEDVLNTWKLIQNLVGEIK